MIDRNKPRDTETYNWLTHSQTCTLPKPETRAMCLQGRRVKGILSYLSIFDLLMIWFCQKAEIKTDTHTCRCTACFSFGDFACPAKKKERKKEKEKESKSCEPVSQVKVISNVSTVLVTPGVICKWWNAAWAVVSFTDSQTHYCHSSSLRAADRLAMTQADSLEWPLLRWNPKVCRHTFWLL